MAREKKSEKILLKGPFKIDLLQLSLMQMFWDSGRTHIQELFSNLEPANKARIDLIKNKLNDLISTGLLKAESYQGVTYCSPNFTREQTAKYWHQYIDKVMFSGLPGEPIPPEPPDDTIDSDDDLAVEETMALYGEPIPPEPPDPDEE